jgi:S1-C subfamily serine protease
VPQKLADLINAGDFGRFANEKGELVVCFIADLDITGGNSGSPCIDADGNLIGIAFDGNWEAMSGDIAYEPELQRTIVVDVRYVLFVIEKLMGGQNITDELKYAKKPSKPQAQGSLGDAKPANGDAAKPAETTPLERPTTPATGKGTSAPKAAPAPAKK